MSIEETPTVGQLRSAYTGWADPSPENNEYEEKVMGEAFDRAIAKIKADALREVAAGFIDWDVIYGNEVATPEIEQSHRAAAYIEREADKIEESAK